ncbi:DUF89 domain-containing protein [Vulcanisaeta sp. JCM 16161]|uniref:ARMT1-like domain-containing protein n=1 Tax=Vulcanisaeta sp. JCM 16161 TaxID=1295372 RepID=UPI0006CFE04A|nr:ARMT1-like domain-containing protein [Vulcanisaeta sp. JCM 16161]
MRGPWYVSINDCLLCVLESRFSELRRLGVNDVRAFADLGRAVMDLASMGRATVFIESFNYIVRITNNVDPHADEKLMLEKTASELISKLGLGDDIVNYVKLAASANSVDIPMRGYSFSVGDFIRNILEEPTWLGTNPEDLRSRLSGAGSIAYLVDNAGEFQFDLLLIRKLSSMGVKVVVYTRSRPYEVDVTYDYVIGFAGEFDVRALPGNYSAFWYDDVVRELMNYDLVISKGLDNLETFMEKRPKLNNVLFLLRAKCPLIAEMLNVERNKPVVSMGLKI